MRKIYSIFIMAVMALAMSFTASADIEVTLKIDDATRLTGSCEYQDENWNYHTVTLDMTQFTGENGGTFTIPSDYGTIYVNATSGNTITYAMNETTGSSSYTGSYTYFYVGEYAGAAQTIVIKSADLDSTRTASCTVTVDDASKVSLSYCTGTTVELVNGENIIKFNPNGETPFNISNVNYGESLYSVKLNGVEQTTIYGRYEVSVVDGDKLDIVANYPQLPAVVSFNYGEKETELLGCVSVEVNGVAVEDFDGKTLNCMLGDKVRIIGDANLYNYNYSIYVNGNYQSFYDETTITITQETNTIDLAHVEKYATYTAYITVDSVDLIDGVYVGNSSTPLSLKSGVQASFEFSTSANYINARPATDCYFISIRVNGEEYGDNYGTGTVTIRNINENDVIELIMGKTVRDKKATVWVDDLNAALYGYNVQRYSDQSYVDLISGEEVTVNFDTADNPYYFAFFMPTYCNLYQNSILVAPYYEGSANYYITLADGDKIRVYLASEPEESVVTFEKIAFTGDNVTVTVDGKVVSNWEAGFTVLKGTEISVTGAQVIVNDTVVNGDGTYTFTADDAETKVVLCDNAVGIEEIEAGANAVEYYNLQGVKVENPEKGVFIKKQGGRTTKVVL